MSGPKWPIRVRNVATRRQIPITVRRFGFRAVAALGGYYSVPRYLNYYPYGIIGTRTSTTIPMLGIRIHIIPLPKALIIVAIGVTAVSISPLSPQRVAPNRHSKICSVIGNDPQSRRKVLASFWRGGEPQ